MRGKNELSNLQRLNIEERTLRCLTVLSSEHVQGTANAESWKIQTHGSDFRPLWKAVILKGSRWPLGASQLGKTHEFTTEAVSPWLLGLFKNPALTHPKPTATMEQEILQLVNMSTVHQKPPGRAIISSWNRANRQFNNTLPSRNCEFEKLGLLSLILKKVWGLGLRPSHVKALS